MITAQQEWIDIKRRMPAAPLRVLIRLEDNYVDIAVWGGVSKQWSKKFNKQVTHWQPLPGPYLCRTGQ